MSNKGRQSSHNNATHKYDRQRTRTDARHPNRTRSDKKPRNPGSNPPRVDPTFHHNQASI